MSRRSLYVAGSLPLVALVLAGFALSQAEEAGDRRYALLVGVKNYQGSGLSNLKYPEDDVQALGEVLRGAGFKRVVVMTQKEALTKDRDELLPTAENIRTQLAALLEDRKPTDTILVFFSGHGVQPRRSKELLFCPRGANLDDPKTLVSLTEVYDRLRAKDADTKGGLKLLLVDACRNDPLEGKGGDERLESVTRPTVPEPPGGVAALFSCSAGQKSYESDAYKHGFFSHFLIEGFKGKAANRKGEVDLLGLARFVKDEMPDAVKEEIGARARQTPHLLGDLREGLALNRVDAATAPGRPADTSPSRPDRGEVRERPATLSVDVGGGTKMEFVRIAAGTFQMGAPDGEKDAGDAEKPRHEETISRPFYLGKYLVTQSEYEALTGKNPSWFSSSGGGKEKVAGTETGRFPVENISWEDAVAYCEKLTDRHRGKGWTFGLPSEAEWEYACRAGTTTPFHFGSELNGRQANCDGNYPYGTDEKGPYLQRTSRVGSYEANKWGLYDMHGNVWEWCRDWYDKDYYRKSDKKDPENTSAGDARVLRGGSFYYNAWFCRAAYRHRLAPAIRLNYLGFRVRLRLD
jgi:formylglycine-generating enzyme required for sulfatase activity